MTREMMVLMLALLMALPSPALVMASGGANPGIERSEKITGPTFNATVVLDPHNPTSGDNPDRIRWATVRIRKGATASGVVFQIPESFPLAYGCQLVSPYQIEQYPPGSELTEIRFVNVALTAWMPTDAIVRLFGGVGMVLNVTNLNFIPMITSVENVVCVPPLPGTGTLSFDAVIQFKVPQN